MKRKLLAVLVSVVMLCAMLPLGAVGVNAETYGDLTYTVANGEVTITNCIDSVSNEVIIPDTIEGYPVTAIHRYAFSECSLTSVTIPDSVTSIGKEAFYRCKNLSSATIGDGVTTIGEKAFYQCSNLSTVTFGNKVTTIGEQAFRDCRNLTNVSLPNSVTTIGGFAFADCNSLTSASIPDGVTVIKEYAFSSCDSLASVTIPKSVITIEGYAFGGCKSLTEVIIPDGVTTIGDWAFNYCPSLTSVSIPISVTAIGENVFVGSNNLKDVYYGGSKKDKGNMTVAAKNDNLLMATWHYAKSEEAEGSIGLLYEIVEDEVVITGYVDYADSDNYDLIIPATIEGYPVTAINRYAFIRCSSLATVTIPNTVTTIEMGTFKYSSIVGVSIPDSVVSIDAEAFAECENLSLVSIPNSVTTIGKEAFSGCHNLSSVTIGDGVTTIGERAFYGCSNLIAVVLSNSVTTIGEWAFGYCNKLASVTIPVSVTYIGTPAFAFCSRLTDVYYGGSRADRMNLAIDESALLNATWHYAKQEPLFSTVVGHSVMDTTNGNGLAFRFQLAADKVEVINGNEASFTNATVHYFGNEVQLVGMGAVMTNDAALGATDFTLDDVNDVNVLNITAVYLCDLEPDSCAFAVRIINIPSNQLERTIYARPYYVVEVDGEKIVVYGDVDAASCAEYM